MKFSMENVLCLQKMGFSLLIGSLVAAFAFFLPDCSTEPCSWPPFSSKNIALTLICGVLATITARVAQAGSGPSGKVQGCHAESESSPHGCADIEKGKQGMKQKKIQRPLITVVAAMVLIAFAMLFARYGVALNPFDGCEFPEGRTSSHQSCHAVNWVWNE